MEQFQTPSRTQRLELEIKRSRFISTAAYAQGRSEAKMVIANIQQEFPDANHHCWAMIAGAPDDVRQHDQSDDGEPRGTAGKPMLNVLQHSELGNIVVVTTRYFGGIKLGAGGLVRAYTRSVSEALADLSTITVYKKELVVIELPYSLFETLGHWLKTTNIQIGEATFAESIQLPLEVPIAELPALEAKMLEIGSGSIRIIDREN